MSVVTEVALNDNDISDLPLYAWQAFRWVRVLSLAKNQLKALGSGARLLAGIETLDLSENRLGLDACRNLGEVLSQTLSFSSLALGRSSRSRSSANSRTRCSTRQRP